MKEKTARLNELNVLLNKSDGGQNATDGDSVKQPNPGEDAVCDRQGEKEVAAAALPDRIDQMLHNYAANVASGNEPSGNQSAEGEENSISRGR